MTRKRLTRSDWAELIFVIVIGWIPIALLAVIAVGGLIAWVL
jgi:hypothetical protein